MKTLSPTSHSHLYGGISGLASNVLHGWAFDAANPDLRLAIEVYVSDACVALVRADLDQGISSADAPGHLGDGFHGFVAELRSSWLRPGASISVRLANQGPWLGDPLIVPFPNDASPLSTQSQQSTPVTALHIWHTGGLTLQGWAWDPQAPDRTLKVRVFEETQSSTTFVAEAFADQPHPAFIYHEHANHGVSISLPWSLADGKPHKLIVESDKNAQLQAPPITLCVHAEGARALLSHTLSADTGNGPGAISLTQHTPPAQALLEALLEQQDILAPRSAGFDVYPQWLATFQRPLPLHALPGMVLVLLIYTDSSKDAARSLQSIQQQRLPSEQIRVFSINADDVNASEKLAQQLAIQLADPQIACLVPLHCDDHLPAHALDTLLNTVVAEDADWCYADCDQDDSYGQRHNPWLKPAWDETLFYGADIVTPGCAISAKALRRAVHHLNQHGTHLPICWHSLLASVIATSQGPVVHLPQVLYHRSAQAAAAPYLAAPDPQRQACVQWLANQRVAGAQVMPLVKHPALLRVQWPLPTQLPTVSLIVPTRDQLALVRTCVEGLLTKTSYPSLEIIVVDNDSSDAQALAWLNEIPQQGVRVLRYPHPFNYAAINNWAIEQAQGEIIGLINNDIAILHPEWLLEMVSHLLRPHVGAVGARLLWPNGMVQHGGVVVGVNGLAAHTGNYSDQHDPGYLGFHQIARQQSAVTAACLLLRKSDYQQQGALDAMRYPVTFNDVDLCLRLREAGLTLVWTPFATLTHAESASRGKEDSPSKVARAQREQRHFLQRWSAPYAAGDPFYHPGLSLDWNTGPYGGLALPPKPFKPRTANA